MVEIRLVQAANALLGEGPSWHAGDGVLYWVDVIRPAVFRYDPAKGQTGLWPLTGTVGCAVPRKDGSLMLGADNSFVALDLKTGASSVLAVAEPDMPHNRFNDGKVDRRSRFWAGTIDRKTESPTGSLYRLDPDLTITRMETGLICSNGLGWSPDDRIMYFTDSMIRTIWAYDFDLASGTIGNRRVFAKLADDDGVPDGLAVDAEGYVWSAVWDGWRIVRYAPDGHIDREVRMPVQRPSSCMFGGPDLRTLYVTSAWAGIPGRDLLNGPLAGSLFAFEPGVGGLPETPFAG